MVPATQKKTELPFLHSLIQTFQISRIFNIFYFFALFLSFIFAFRFGINCVQFCHILHHKLVHFFCCREVAFCHCQLSLITKGHFPSHPCTKSYIKFQHNKADNVFQFEKRKISHAPFCSSSLPFRCVNIYRRSQLTLLEE